MKTEAEMYSELKKLEKKILETQNKINKHYRKFSEASLGPNYASKPYGTKNLPTFTNQNYRRFLKEGLRLSYNVHRPLIAHYLQAVNKYRRHLGLPPVNRLGRLWNNVTHYSRTVSGNSSLPTVSNLIGMYMGQYYQPQIGSGSGRNYKQRSIGIVTKKFYPNVQLLNRLKPSYLRKRNTNALKALSPVTEPSLRRMILTAARSAN
jgi:hypothetical protein